MSMNRKLIEDAIRPEDLPNPDLQKIALLCGMEMALKLLRNFEGRSVYFNRHWFANFIQRYVSQHYNGENTKELAEQLGVSYMTIYRATEKKAVRGALIESRKAPGQQLDIFKPLSSGAK